MRSLLALVFASLLLAGCGARLEPASTGCPPPNPGLCAPSVECQNGVRRTGQASCVDGNWVCAEEACGDAGTDACDGSIVTTCEGGRILTTCCPPNGFCLTGDFCDLGGGACTPGACGGDAGACDGYAMPYCDATGHVASGCCPAGANCSPPASFCDHHDGTCSAGECPLDGGAADACASISASSYDRACASDADCAAVYAGALCGACRCPNAAIAKSALPDYEKDVSASHPGPSTCACPLIPTPVCRAGACTMP